MREQTGDEDKVFGEANCGAFQQLLKHGDDSVGTMAR